MWRAHQRYEVSERHAYVALGVSRSAQRYRKPVANDEAQFHKAVIALTYRYRLYG